MNTPLPLKQWLSPARPDETPIAWGDKQRWTLGQLRRDVARLQAWLRQQNAQRWALCFDNSYLFIVALLATLGAGKTPVIPGHRRLALLEEQQALFEGLLSDEPMSWQGPFHCVASTDTAAPATVAAEAITDSQTIELFTSGSTGQPRRIVKSIASLDREAGLLASRFAGRLNHCRVVASVIPLHLYGLTFRIFLPMALGLPLHAETIRYAEQLSALSDRYRYLFVSSPAFLKRLDHRLTPPRLAMLLSAGGAMGQQEAAAAQAWCGIWPDEIYGSTETGVLAWRSREHASSPWHPFPGVAFTAQEESFIAHSPLIDNPAGVLLDDILHFDASGAFHLAGRRGRVVKIEEKRISLCDVERRLLALDGVRDAAALCVTRNGRQTVGALLVLDNTRPEVWQGQRGRALQLKWRQALRPWLEPVAIPRYWRVVDAIPVNTMDKRVYTQLQELFNETA